jgi:hypothetical protein
MTNIVEVLPVKDPRTRTFIANSRTFVLYSLGQQGWKLVEDFTPFQGFCVRCIDWGSKDPVQVIEDYLQVEASKEKNTPPR